MRRIKHQVIELIYKSFQSNPVFWELMFYMMGAIIYSIAGFFLVV